MGTIRDFGVVNDSGTADALEVTTDDVGYYDGQRVLVRVVATNTGNATLSISGKTAKNIKKFNDETLAAGDIEAGQIAEFVYDEDNGVFQMITAPATSISGAE